MIFLRSLISWFKALFKPSEPVEETEKIFTPPNLKDAWLRMKDFVEDFDDLSFYMQQIKTKYTPNTVRFINAAEFNLVSVRDELKILLDQENENERKRKYESDPSRVIEHN